MKLALFYVILIGITFFYSEIGAFSSWSNIFIFIGFPAVFIIVFFKPQFGLFLVVAVSPIFNQKINIGLSNMWFHQWVILATSVAVISKALISKELLTYSRNPLNISILIFCIIFGLSAQISSGIPNGIMLKYALYYGVFFASFYITLLVIKDEKTIERTISFLCISTIAACMIALFLTRSFASPETRLAGYALLSNPNSLGNFLAITTSFLIAYVTIAPLSRRKKILIFITAGISIISLILTLSRSSWLGFAGSIFILFLLRPRAWFMFIVLIGIVISIIGTSDVEKRLLEKSASVEYRLDKARIALEMTPKSPLIGNGPGAFETEIRNEEEYRPTELIRHTSLENQYLLLLCEHGILGLLTFLTIIFIFLKECMNSYLQTEYAPLKSLALASGISVISCLFISFGETVFSFPKLNWLVGIIMGFFFVMKRCSEKKNNNEMTYPELDAPGLKQHSDQF